MKTIVIGDLMLDVNYFSFSNRTAPEANIPIYNINNIKYNLGGAANVAINFKRMDVDIELIGIINNDFYGEKIKELLLENQIKNKILVDSKRKTTVKNRIFNQDTLVCRYDVEDTDYIDNIFEIEILNYIKSKKDINIIVISDYNKGLITDFICKNIIEYSNLNNIYTFVDPKIKNYSKYKNCFCFKPNLNEGIQLSNCFDICKIMEWIKININCKHVVLTDGKNGLYLDNKNNNFKYNKNINVIDVTGAGDITLVILVYIFYKTMDINKACEISTIIGSLSVENIGNYIVDKNIVDDFISI